jgi:hypothetical protein
MKPSKKEILEAIHNYYEFPKKRDFAEFLGISSAVLANWYNRETFDYGILIEKCDEIDFNLLFSEGVAVKAGSKNPDEEIVSENRDETIDFYSILKEKDRQIVEMSEKIGQLKEQIRQYERNDNIN